MIQGLNQDEFKLAKELTNVALANASRSFTKMTGEQFSFQTIEIHVDAFELQHHFQAVQEPLYIMLTQYVGDVLADTFLIMTPANAKEFTNKLYPAPDLDETLHNAILLEIDNITAAAIATKYADFLNHNVTGAVPKMERKSAADIQAYINEQLGHDHTHFSYTTCFRSKKQNLEAYFICAFQDSFGNAIKKAAAKQETKALIVKEEQQAQQYLQNS